MKALVARLRAPVYSVKQPEAFQVSTTLPVPQPSTLAGALAYAIAIRHKIGLQEAVEEALHSLILARARFLSEVAIPSYVLLRRFRMLDKGMERKEKEPIPLDQLTSAFTQKRFDEAIKIIEGQTDALYREYIFTQELQCMWVVSDNKLMSDLLWYIHRVGDTESLCQVIDANEFPVKRITATTVKTTFPVVWHQKIRRINGSYLCVKMEPESFLANRKSMKKTYVIPCREEIRRTNKGFKYRTYIPTEVEVSYEEPMQVLRVEGIGDIVQES